MLKSKVDMSIKKMQEKKNTLNFSRGLFRTQLNISKVGPFAKIVNG